MKIKFNTKKISQDELQGLFGLVSGLLRTLTIDEVLAIEKQRYGYTEESREHCGESESTSTTAVDEKQHPEQTTCTTAVDSEDLPWDARIHSETKAKLANGNWRRRRNVDDSLYERVIEELKATMALPGTEIAANPSVTFVELVTTIGDLLTKKELTQEDLALACAAIQITHVQMLANRPDLIPAFMEALKL